jgi:hypothetical protein
VSGLWWCALACLARPRDVRRGADVGGSDVGPWGDVALAAPLSGSGYEMDTAWRGGDRAARRPYACGHGKGFCRPGLPADQQRERRHGSRAACSPAELGALRSARQANQPSPSPGLLLRARAIDQAARAMIAECARCASSRGREPSRACCVPPPSAHRTLGTSRLAYQAGGYLALY